MIMSYCVVHDDADEVALQPAAAGTGTLVNAAPPRLHEHVAPSASSGRAWRLRRSSAPRSRRCPRSTAALRAPSRAAFAALFHEWNANPKSMIPKTNMKKSEATIANSTAAAPVLVDAIRPRRDDTRKPRAALERLRGWSGALGCASGSSSVPNGSVGMPATTLGSSVLWGYSVFPGWRLRTSTYAARRDPPALTSREPFPPSRSGIVPSSFGHVIAQPAPIRARAGALNDYRPFGSRT